MGFLSSSSSSWAIPRILLLLLLLLSLWSSLLHHHVVVEASPFRYSILATTSIPRSTPRRHHNDNDDDDDDATPPWNPSSHINDDGFLKQTYTRLPGDWEYEARLGGKHGCNSRRFRELSDIPVQIRQVPGDGNCLFHSIATCLSYVVNGTHVPRRTLLQDLRQNSAALRRQAVQCLEQHPRRVLFLQGQEYVTARELVDAAAAQYGLSGEEYCDMMRRDSYWGGGPEIVALCNVLRRPIHVYELHHEKKKKNNKNNNHEQFRLRRMACFGSPKFDRREPLHILSADSRFPDVAPGRQLESGNHFLSLFPVDERHLSSLQRNLRKKAHHHLRAGVRGGENHGHVKEEEEEEKHQQVAVHHHHITSGWNQSLLHWVSMWWSALTSFWLR